MHRPCRARPDGDCHVQRIPSRNRSTAALTVSGAVSIRQCPAFGIDSIAASGRSVRSRSRSSGIRPCTYRSRQWSLATSSAESDDAIFRMTGRFRATSSCLATLREREILDLMSQGRRNSEIADVRRCRRAPRTATCQRRSRSSESAREPKPHSTRHADRAVIWALDWPE